MKKLYKNRIKIDRKIKNKRKIYGNKIRDYNV